MDVFSPLARTNGVAIVDVVSGAWSSDRNKIRDHTVAQVYTILCGRGYTVFAVRPGSKSRYTLAEMDQNVKTGIRFIKQHADEHGVDPARLGMTGASAGGHLATLAALTPDEGKPDAKNPGQRFDTRLKAISVFFPPTDLVEWDTGKPADPKLILPLLFPGGAAGHSAEEITAMAKAVSPLYRVTQPKSPFLIFHGDADGVVPLSHSQKLVAAIQQAGGSAELVIKPGGGHPWLTMPVEVGKMADWFDQQLLRSSPKP
jgi:acetyl esterase/lipase